MNDDKQTPPATQAETERDREIENIANANRAVPGLFNRAQEVVRILNTAGAQLQIRGGAVPIAALLPDRTRIVAVDAISMMDQLVTLLVSRLEDASVDIARARQDAMQAAAQAKSLVEQVKRLTEERDETRVSLDALVGEVGAAMELLQDAFQDKPTLTLVWGVEELVTQHQVAMGLLEPGSLLAMDGAEVSTSLIERARHVTAALAAETAENDRRRQTGSFPLPRADGFSATMTDRPLLHNAEVPNMINMRGPTRESLAVWEAAEKLAAAGFRSVSVQIAGAREGEAVYQWRGCGNEVVVRLLASSPSASVRVRRGAPEQGGDVATIVSIALMAMEAIRREWGESPAEGPPDHDDNAEAPQAVVHATEVEALLQGVARAHLQDVYEDMAQAACAPESLDEDEAQPEPYAGEPVDADPPRQISDVEAFREAEAAREFQARDEWPSVPTDNDADPVADEPVAVVLPIAAGLTGTLEGIVYEQEQYMRATHLGTTTESDAEPGDGDEWAVDYRVEEPPERGDLRHLDTPEWPLLSVTCDPAPTPFARPEPSPVVSEGVVADAWPMPWLDRLRAMITDAGGPWHAPWNQSDLVPAIRVRPDADRALFAERALFVGSNPAPAWEAALQKALAAHSTTIPILVLSDVEVPEFPSWAERVRRWNAGEIQRAWNNMAAEYATPPDQRAADDSDARWRAFGVKQAPFTAPIAVVPEDEHAAFRCGSEVPPLDWVCWPERANDAALRSEVAEFEAAREDARESDGWAEEVGRIAYGYLVEVAPSELMGGDVNPATPNEGERSAAISKIRRIAEREDGSWVAHVVTDGKVADYSACVGETALEALSKIADPGRGW